jgi:hypothetical protein
MKTLNKLIFLVFLFYSHHIFGQKQILRFKSIEKTYTEKGKVKSEFDLKELKRLYKKSKIIFEKDNLALKIRNQNGLQEVLLDKKRFVPFGISNSIESQNFPTDDIEDCFYSEKCMISLELLKMLDFKITDLSFFLGFSEEKRYVFFISNHDKYALLSVNEFVLIKFK